MDRPTESDDGRRPRWAPIALVVGTLLAAGLAAEIAWTRPVRRSLHAYSALIAAANRQDLATARALCSARYLRDHGVEPAPEGGIVGLPRMLVHKNFQAWRQGPEVWVCPTNRVGPVFRFVREAGEWKFDGPVGLLRPGNVVERLDEEPPIGTGPGRDRGPG